MGFVEFLIKTDLFDVIKKNRKKSFVQVLQSNPFPMNKVIPDNTSLHNKQGWVKNGNRHYGYYRTLYGAWSGEIVRRGDKFDVFIIDPPIHQLKKHSRWICIHKIDNQKYEVRLATQPKDRDIDGIIFYIEKLIIESFRIR